MSPIVLALAATSGAAPAAPLGASTPQNAEQREQHAAGASSSAGVLVPEASDPASPPPEGHTRGFAMEGGASYAQFFGIPTWGGEATFSVRLPSEEGRVSLGFSAERFETEHGLDIWGARFAPAYEWQLGRVQLGMVGRAGIWEVVRFTSGSEPIASLGIGAALRAGFDVWRWEDSALFLRGEVRVDSYFDPLVLGGHVGVGYRWGQGHAKTHSVPTGRTL